MRADVYALPYEDNWAAILFTVFADNTSGKEREINGNPLASNEHEYKCDL